jgi:uncharacterized repeat protein (TIGR03803 family)
MVTPAHERIYIYLRDKEWSYMAQTKTKDQTSSTGPAREKAHMDTLAHDQAFPTWWICLRTATTALAVGIMLLSAVTEARSQVAEAPKPPAYTVLYTFTGGADGANPNTGGSDAGLIRDEEGNLYGTTTSGGNLSVCPSFFLGSGCGVVFKLDRSGKETVLHAFTGSPDGGGPIAGLVQDEEGNLYGTTNGGGSSVGGTVFKLDRAGKEIVLHSFVFPGADGNSPYGAGVIRDEEGNLYGTTLGGGSSRAGTVFRLEGTGKETVLHSFTGSPDGVFPVGGLVRDEEGNLYGTTLFGGGFGSGTVFKVDRGGKETVLYSFTGGADGAQPAAGLVRDEEGNFYGTASAGGASGNGVVFRLDRTGKFTVVYTLTGGRTGQSLTGVCCRSRATFTARLSSAAT